MKTTFQRGGSQPTLENNEFSRQQRFSNQNQSNGFNKPPRVPPQFVESQFQDTHNDSGSPKNALVGMRGIPISTSSLFGNNNLQSFKTNANTGKNGRGTGKFFSPSQEAAGTADFGGMIANYNSGAQSRAFMGNRTAKTANTKGENISEDYNFMARGHTAISSSSNNKRIKSAQKISPGSNSKPVKKQSLFGAITGQQNQMNSRVNNAKENWKAVNNGYNRVASQNDIKEPFIFQMPFNSGKNKGILNKHPERAGKQTNISDTGYNYQHQNSQSTQNKHGKNVFTFSPVSQQVDNLPFFSEQNRISEPFSADFYKGSRSRSPESSILANVQSKGSPKNHDGTLSQLNQKKIQEYQFNQQDLHLGADIKQQVALNKLLTMNNFSRMLQNVQRSKKDLNQDHKVLQNVKLVSTLQSSIQDEIIKGRQQNHQAIKQFVDMTDSTLKKLIPKEDAWQMKSYVNKNLNLRIHTAEMINSKRPSLTSGFHQKNISDLIDDIASNQNSPKLANHQRATSQGSRLIKSSMSKTRDFSKKNNKFLQKKDYENLKQQSPPEDQQYQDENNSYDIYVDALSRRANMQQMISQNLIKVKYVKDADKNKGFLNNSASESNMSRNKNNQPSMAGNSTSSFKTIDDMILMGKNEKIGNKEGISLDEEKYIIDYVTERDIFILKNKKKHRIIFNLDNISEKEMRQNLIEISNMSIKDFLKNNRITPKLFHFDQFEQTKQNSNFNKKLYYLQKSSMLLQTQKITQARTFLINAVKEFPEDVPLLFNKGLVHYLRNQFKDSASIYYDILGRVQTKNNALLNLFLCHLHQKQYEDILELESQIVKKDDFLDYTEKWLRLMASVANERLLKEEPQRHEAYSKIVRDRQARQNWEAKIKIQSSSSPKYKDLFPFNNIPEFTLGGENQQKYVDIIFEDEEKISILDNEDKTHDFHSRYSKGNKKSCMKEGDQDRDLDLLNVDITGKNHHKKSDSTRQAQNTALKVQFTQNFSEAFQADSERPQDKQSIIESIPPQLEYGKVYEIDDQFQNLKLSESGEIINEQDQHQILQEIAGIRKFCDSDDNAIIMLQKFEKRKVGSTKIVLQRSEELLARKYKLGLQYLLDINSKYYYIKYLDPSDETLDGVTANQKKKIKVDSQKLMNKGGKELEIEEQKLMSLLGISKEKIQERMKKYQQDNAISNNQSSIDKTKSNNSSFVGQKVHKKEKEAEKKEFEPKTFDFIQFLFIEYGLKEVIVPGTENASIFQDIRNLDSLNAYVNKLSEFMTTKSVFFASDRQSLQNQDEMLLKEMDKKRRLLKGNYDSDAEDSARDNQNGQIKKDEGDHASIQTDQNMIEQFQNVLEYKIVEMLSDQREDEANFYTSLLQKLNAIDLLQLFLKQCAKKIMGDERLLTFKKELSFGMLQIFREEISKKFIIERNDKLSISNNKVRINYDLIDKTLRKLRFFKNFAQDVRLKLYKECKYEIVPPGRIIAHQEELESHIFVLISGIASLTVKYIETNESYSGMLIYPGDAIGDANIKDKIVISKGRGETKTYVSSVKECDVLVFERRQFTDVLFKDMMDSLYEKIMCMRNSEFFENLSPYAMVILCSNIELQEYSYGDVILRQECEPDECYIIISGECKLVLETVIYKAQEEPAAKKSSLVMKFGQQNYNPSEKYGEGKKHQNSVAGDKEKPLINQRKLNEKFSFQHETLDFPQQDSERSQSPMFRAPIINNTDIPFSEQKHGSKMIAYRHHLFYDKVAQGKVLCSRALLEKDYIRKFINKKFEHFKEQLDGPNFLSSSSEESLNNSMIKPIDSNNPGSMSPPGNRGGLNSKKAKQQVLQFTESKDHSKELEQERGNDIDRMYQDLMKSQLTVIADQAVVKVLKLTRKSKKYLSDPLKAMIDNRVYDTKFKDYDRPFKNQGEVQKFIDGQRKWEQYKDRISKNIVQKYVYK